jgi:hypothetical protein
MTLNDFITLHLDLVNLKLNKNKSNICLSRTICLNKDCNKGASCNYKNTNSLKKLNIRKCIYCSKHKLNNMIDIYNKKCIICKIKHTSCNYENEKIPLYCGDCKLENMINIISKKCIICKMKQPVFNSINEKIALYCGDCKLENMINIKHKRCIECKVKRPTFNFVNKKIALYCGSCKLKNMVDINHKKCIICKIKIPSFNYKNEKEAIYCKECKLDDMVEIRSKKCKTPLCDIQVKNKFKGYCLRCFIHTFPESKIIRDYGTREAKVTNFIKCEFSNLNITYNKQIQGGCSQNRPDIFIDCLTHSVIIEVDENQHKAKLYTPECEIQRINNLFTDLADRPIIFIRFNPDSYINSKNKLIKSCFDYTEDKGLPKANKTLQHRLNKLKEEIQKNINEIPVINITTIKLFYDGY